MSKRCEIAKKSKEKQKKIFKIFASDITREVMVTSNDMAICSSLQSDGHL